MCVCAVASAVWQEACEFVSQLIQTPHAFLIPPPTPLALPVTPSALKGKRQAQSVQSHTVDDLLMAVGVQLIGGDKSKGKVFTEKRAGMLNSDRDVSHLQAPTYISCLGLRMPAFVINR